MRRLQLALALALVALMAGAMPVAAGSPPASRDAKASTKVFEKSSAIIVFKALPLATYDGRVKGYERTKPTAGKKLNPNSAAAKKYLGYLKTQHSAYATWLRANAPGARITSNLYVTLNAVAVKLNGNSLAKLKSNSAVSVAEYTTLYRQTMSESHKIINADAAWADSQGGRAKAGAGVKIGIIDSGIDATHPFFDPSGFSYPAGFPKCDARDSSGGQCKAGYVSPKVIVAKVFHNKLNQSGFDAKPLPNDGDHGTHVAGTAAGVTGKTAIVHDVAIDDMSGVAPGAWLGNYNVFPGTVLDARSEDILNAVEAAVIDGMDVLNLSLGGGYRGNNDLLAKGLDTAVAAGVVVVTSGGNEGPGGFTIGSPGRARNIITTGASTNQHFVGQPVRYGANGLARAAVGDFPALDDRTYDVVDTGSLACAAGTPGTTTTTNPPLGNLSGKLALVNRGVCVFSEKVFNAKQAGAIAVIVVNNVAGDPTAMGITAIPAWEASNLTPAVMISKGDGAALRAFLATSAPNQVTADDNFAEFITDNGDIMAGFSSQGPTFVNYAVKPDLTSVGVNVLSSVVCEGTSCADDWEFFNGTSMASPHIAGSAAVLLEQYGRDQSGQWRLSPAKVKSMLVNTADPVVKNAFDASTIVGPQLQGGGREDLGEAHDAKVVFSPVSASYGRISASRTRSTPLTITVRNLTNTQQTFTVSEQEFVLAPTTSPQVRLYGGGTLDGADDDLISPTGLVVPANGSATLTLRVKAGLANGTRVQGWVVLTNTADETQVYQVAYWAQVAP